MDKNTIFLLGEEFYKKFSAWLASKHPQTNVGRTLVCASCPISQFLNEYYSTPGTCFTTRRSVHIRGASYLLPPWTIAFIAKLDDTNPSHNVTAADALAVLRNIPFQSTTP